MAQTIYTQALSDAEKKRLAQIAQTQGAGAASSLALQMANAQNTTTPTPKGATTPTNNGGAVPAQVQQAQQQAQAIRDLQQQQRQLQQAQQSGNIQAVNQILREQAQQQNIQSAQQSGNTQLAAQMQLAQAAEARANAINSGSTPAPLQQNPYQAALAQATPQTTQPVQMKDYLIFGSPSAGFQSGMSAANQASWDAIGRKYAAGDTSWNKDTNAFRDEGNWGSYYDANGNINGWLYAADGMGDYVPVFGGKVGETGYKAGSVFISPDGKAYTMAADGTLTQSGNAEWAKYGEYVGPKAGYQDSSFWALEDGQYKKYTNQTAPEEVLEAAGYYRNKNGLVLPIDDQYRLAQAVKNGDITVEQAALAQAVANRNAGAIPTVQPTAQPTQQVQPTQPIRNTPQYTQAPQTTQPSPQAKPLPKDQQVQTQTVSRIDPTAFQSYLDQWSYGPAPEWTGGQDETWKEVYNYDYGEAPTWEGSQYDALRDQYLRDAAGMSWNGSQYDPLRDAALAAYGEKWQGSEYQKQRDEALRRAQDMRFNYDPSTDPVWQALQKQYRREGDRASQEALAQAAMRTGGLANSYAVTAATQAGDYYAAQLSDRLPQLYQDAYQRYLQEFQRQMGISDQYAGFDDREYARWADQQGKNLDLADRYNQYGQQEYGKFQDEYGRRLDAVDRYNQYGQQEYGKYQDRLGQFNTDRNFQYGLNRDYVSDAERANQTAYSRYLDSLDQYNRDRAMSYEQFRDAVGDMRYADETAYSRNYRAQRDAIEDQRYDQQWAQQLREYADAQGWKQAEWQQYLREYGDQLSEKERQWAYQMARDAVEDNRWERQYADSRGDTAYERALRENELAYDRAWNEENRDYTRGWNEDERDYERGWDTTKWNQALREYDDEQAQQAWNNDYKLSGRNSGGSGGGYSGGSSGGGKTTGGDDLGPGQYKQGGIVFRSDKTHPQGQPMSAQYEQAYNDTWDKWQHGMDYALLIAEVRELAINKTITDYEGQMILNELKKWKEQGRMIDASKGGGMGSPRTQMTR